MKQTKAGSGSGGAGTSTEVYDISRFHKAMSKTQMIDLKLPSPPLLEPRVSTNASRYVNVTRHL